jgi:hypothetical protein
MPLVGEPLRLQAVRLLRVQTLLDGDFHKLPRFQDLPATAFHTPPPPVGLAEGSATPAITTTQANYDPTVTVTYDSLERVFFLSHRWQEAADPDSSGQTLRFLRNRLRRLNPSEWPRTGIFIDYCCLPQQNRDGIRTADEDIVFRTGLKQLEDILLWPGTTIVVAFAGDYLMRSWCIYEAASALSIYPRFDVSVTRDALPALGLMAMAASLCHIHHLFLHNIPIWWFNQLRLLLNFVDFKRSTLILYLLAWGIPLIFQGLARVGPGIVPRIAPLMLIGNTLGKVVLVCDTSMLVGRSLLKVSKVTNDKDKMPILFGFCNRDLLQFAPLALCAVHEYGILAMFCLVWIPPMRLARILRPILGRGGASWTVTNLPIALLFFACML